MCQQLNISRAGYYKWLNREKPPTESENEQIALWIKEWYYVNILDTKSQTFLGCTSSY